MKNALCIVWFFLVMMVAGCASSSAKLIGLETATKPAEPSPSQKKVASGKASSLEKIIAAGIEQVGVTISYDPAYAAIGYPNGDVPKETGVCADVIVRAFRGATIDLQKELHEDMKNNFSEYPKTWGAKKTDASIDHRRVGNLMKWFERKKKSLPLSREAKDYLPGDVVAWELDSGRLHIGLVTDLKTADQKKYLIAHNIGSGAQLEDVLFEWKVIGHYRYFNLP
jgi:hypothetical protein